MPHDKPSLIWIYLAIFVNVVAFSMVFPLLPTYATTFGASGTVIGIMAASFALAQFLFSPFWGRLSDRFGRKPIIMIGLIGIAGSFLVFGLAANLFTLFVSRFFQGVFSAATLPAGRAYVADVSSKEERVKAMGRLSASHALGIILGPAIGGFLAQVDIAFPFYLAAAIALLNSFFVFQFLPESVTEKVRHKIRSRHTVFANFFAMKNGFQGTLLPLYLLGFLWSFSLSNMQVTMPLLGLDKFNMDTTQIGFVFTVMGLTSATIQFFLLSRIVKLFRGEHHSVIIALLMLASGFTIMPFLPPYALFLYLAIVLAGLGSAIARPVTTTLISRETAEKQGVTMGTASAFESMGRFVGPIMGGFLFEQLGSTAPFLFTGITVAIVITYIVTRTPLLSSKHITSVEPK